MHQTAVVFGSLLAAVSPVPFASESGMTPRQSVDAISLVFEECRFQGNAVGGVGGGAGHATGSVRTLDVQLLPRDFYWFSRTEASAGPYTFRRCWFIGNKAAAGQGTRRGFLRVKPSQIGPRDGYPGVSGSPAVQLLFHIQVEHSVLKCHRLCTSNSLM